MHKQDIDRGREFDFGRVSGSYARYRDIYPASLYDKLRAMGIGKPGQLILDLGSGTGVLPRHLYTQGVRFTVTDISPEQIAVAKSLAAAGGMDMSFCVCSAEDTGFADGSFDIVTAVQCFRYFDTARAVPEIARVLDRGGRFCRIDMEWLPHEDKVAALTERLVLRYNPQWTGGGFSGFRYRWPDWAEDRFELEAVHCWREEIPFTPEAWRGRIQTCRGVGASLSPAQAERFDRELAAQLAPYDRLEIRHQLQIELYRKL